MRQDLDKGQGIPVSWGKLEYRDVQRELQRRGCGVNILTIRKWGALFRNGLLSWDPVEGKVCPLFTEGARGLYPEEFSCRYSDSSRWRIVLREEEWYSVRASQERRERIKDLEGKRLVRVLQRHGYVCAENFGDVFEKKVVISLESLLDLAKRAGLQI